MHSYNFELKKICKIVNQKNYSLVAIQLPEGLKIYFKEILEFIEKNTKAKVVFSANPCYGSCDLADNLKELGVEFLVHFGHSKITKGKIPILFIELHSQIDVLNAVGKSLKLLNKNVGLITTVQHVKQLKKVKNFLEKNKFNVFIGKGSKRVKYNGQILGCDFSSAKNIANKVDNFLFIGSGVFHAIGVSISTNKKVVCANPFTNEVFEIEEDKILKKRFGLIEKAKNYKNFGIIIGEKFAQRRINLALKLKKIAEEKNKKAFLISLNEVNENIDYLLLDAFVSTICPRVAIDDIAKFKKIILTPQEFEIVLGIRKWKDYELDEF